MFNRRLAEVLDFIFSGIDNVIYKIAKWRRLYPIIVYRSGQGRDSFSETEVAEYWIGKGIDYKSLWHAYEDGSGYITKFFERETYLLRIKFADPSINAPLFNHEAVHKTLKGCFHDLKVLCFSWEEYNNALPLFSYSVERGSGIWDVLGGLRQLLLFGTTLSDELLIGQQFKNKAERFEFLKKHFGDYVHPEDFEQFMNAQGSEELDFAFKKLYNQKIISVQISRTAFDGDIERARKELLELKAVKDREEFPPR